MRSTHMINGRIIIFEVFGETDAKADTLDMIEGMENRWPGTDGHVFKFGKRGAGWYAIRRGRVVE